MDLRDSSCCCFAILPAPAQRLLSTLLLSVGSNFYLPHLVLVGIVISVVIVFTNLLSVRKLPVLVFHVFKVYLFLVDLVLDV